MFHNLRDRYCTREIIFSGLNLNILRVMGGSLGVQLTSFIISVIIGRTMTKDAFANFIICLTTMEFLRFFAQFGLRASAIRFACLEEAHGKSVFPVFASFLVLIVGTTFSIFLLMIVKADYISFAWLKDIELAPLLKICAVHIISISIFESVVINYNVREEYGALAWCNITLGLFRITLVLISLTIFPGNLMPVIAAWSLSPLLACLVYWRFFWQLLRHRSGWTAWTGRLISFSKWIFLGVLLSMLCNRLDFYFLNWYGVKAAVADYGVAMTIAMALKLYAGSAASVLMPMAYKKISDSSDLVKYIRTVAKIALFGLGIIAIIGLAGSPAIRLIYGQKFSGSFIPTFVLAIGYLLFLIQELLSLIFIGLGKPSLKALLNFSQLGLLVVAGYLLIPKYFAIGAAFSVVFMHLGGVIIALGICGLIFRSSKLLPQKNNVGSF